MTKGASENIVIRRLSALHETDIGELAAVLIDCVEGGASVSFHAAAIASTRPVTSGATWRARPRAVRALILVARDADGIVGTVQIVLAQPDNQPHAR